jgi:hypothetical protein
MPARPYGRGQPGCTDAASPAVYNLKPAGEMLSNGEPTWFYLLLTMASTPAFRNAGHVQVCYCCVRSPNRRLPILTIVLPSSIATL